MFRRQAGRNVHGCGGGWPPAGGQLRGGQGWPGAARGGQGWGGPSPTSAPRRAARASLERQPDSKKAHCMGRRPSCASRHVHLRGHRRSLSETCCVRGSRSGTPGVGGEGVLPGMEEACGPLPGGQARRDMLLQPPPDTDRAPVLLLDAPPPAPDGPPQRAACTLTSLPPCLWRLPLAL